jgi:hypothetical protein
MAADAGEHRKVQLGSRETIPSRWSRFCSTVPAQPVEGTVRIQQERQLPLRMGNGYASLGENSGALQAAGSRPAWYSD